MFRINCFFPTVISNPKQKSKFTLGICFFSIAFFLQGCALSLLDFATPRTGYTLERDVSYGPKPRQSMDIYTPDTEFIQPLTVVFVYGGSWQEGSKEEYRFVAQAFAAAGYRVLIPNYRLYPEVLFPDFVEDVAMAIATFSSANPQCELVLIGHSAGAQIVSMLALDERYLTVNDVSRATLKAWVGWSGPYDFLPIRDPDLKQIFSGKADLQDSQAINFVDKNDPPALLIHGLDDTTVLAKNSENLMQEMKNKGVLVEVKFYPDVDHVDTVGSVSPLLRHWSATFDDTLIFLKSL